MDYLVLTGTPYQIGQQKAMFDGNYLDSVMEYYDKDKCSSFEQWIEQKAIPYVSKEYTDMAEEIQGYLDVSGYNKLYFYKYLFSQTKAKFNCANIVLYTEDAGWVAAKNTDLKHFEYSNIFFYHYQPSCGQEFFCYDYKGSFGGQGMNKAGFCQGGTSMSGIVDSPDKSSEVGAPLAFIVRKNIQYATTANEAVVNWLKPFFDKGVASINLDANGNSYHINRSLSICDIHENTVFPSICTGFFDSHKYQWHEEFQEPLAWSEASIEYARIFFKKKKVYLQDLIDFLRSHGKDWAQYGQWCRHYPEDKMLCTVVSHICIPAQRKILYCHGNPCANSYKEFVFK